MSENIEKNEKVEEKNRSLKERFSFSRLKLFEECPFRFFKKYVEGYEEPVTLPLALGKATHRGIQDKINGIPHEEAVINGYIEAEFFPGLTYEEISVLVNNAKLPVEPVHTEMYFELPLIPFDEHSPKINGYIDVISTKGDFIIDWKTNRKMYHVLDTYQVGLYAWAAHCLYGVQNVVGTLYFLRFKKQSTHVFTFQDMENARIWALNLAEAIRAKIDLYEAMPNDVEFIFPAKPSANCKNCPFVMECYRRFPS